MPMTQKEMVKHLEKNGFYTVPRQGKGSHVKMNKKGQRRPIIIPSGALSKGTEHAILKQAGLK